MSSEAHFEAHQLLGTSIRDLGLAIEGTDLEPLVEEFRKELDTSRHHATETPRLPVR